LTVGNLSVTGGSVQVGGTPGRPQTILRTTTPQISGTTAGGKQIITVHKSGSSNQPQIVTLVKTTQGMTVAPVSQPLNPSIVFWHCMA